MRRPLTWLHVVLSFALILNGIAGAQASTRMSLQHAGLGEERTQKQAPELASQAPPCEEHAGMVSSEAGTNPDAIIDTASDTKHSPDCCKSGACRCQCVHQSQVVIATGLFSGPAIGHDTSVRAMTSAHAEALLPHLIRPPIG